MEVVDLCYEYFWSRRSTSIMGFEATLCGSGSDLIPTIKLIYLIAAVSFSFKLRLKLNCIYLIRASKFSSCQSLS